MPIFLFWPESPYTPVEFMTSNSFPPFLHCLTFSVLMQWAEGGRYSSFTIPSAHPLLIHLTYSLDDFIDVRLGRGTPHIHIDPLAPFSFSSSSAHISTPPAQGHPDDSEGMGGDIHSRSARIQAFRTFQRAPPDERERMRRRMEQRGQSWKAVHLLSAEEVKSLFMDVVEGLGFLVGFSPAFQAMVLTSVSSIINPSCTWT
jgi:hypothetical protein